MEIINLENRLENTEYLVIGQNSVPVVDLSVQR